MWFFCKEKEEIDFPKTLEKAIYFYHHDCKKVNNDAPFTIQHPTGNCIAIFKGDIKDCQKVEEFILNMHKKIEDADYE